MTKRQITPEEALENYRAETLKFADLLDRLSRDIRSERVRLVEADHQRETDTNFDSGVGVISLTGRETLSIDFYRSSQEKS